MFKHKVQIEEFEELYTAQLVIELEELFYKQVLLDKVYPAKQELHKLLPVVLQAVQLLIAAEQD